MIVNILKYISVFVTCLFCCEALNGQALRPDSSNQQEALNHTIKYFTTAIGEQSRLYNGPEYYQYDPAIKGNAYYEDVNTWKIGSVYYDDVLYQDIQMMYDIYKDCVVVLLYNKASRYTLLNDKLRYFDLSGRHFIAFDADSLKNSGIRGGIFNQLYQGKTQVLVKKSKTIQIGTGGSNLDSYFTTGKEEIYLKKGRVYYSIDGKAAILKALQDKKKQIQMFISDNHINYKKNPEQALVSIASYYDRLTN